MLQASARRATARNVSCSPAPAIIIGGRGFCTGFGSRIASSTWKYLPWNVVRFSVHIARISRTASSVCRMRTAACREFPAILAVLRLEISGADTERQPPTADQIDAGGHLGQMRGIAVADRGGKRRQPNAAGHRSERRQDSPPFHKGLIGRADAMYLDQMVHHREPDKAVVLGPLRHRIDNLESFGRIRTVNP